MHMGDDGTTEINSVDDINVGDCLYQEERGKTYWVKDISDDTVVLTDVGDSGESWIKDTLDQAFAAREWVRQTPGVPQIERDEE